MACDEGKYIMILTLPWILIILNVLACLFVKNKQLLLCITFAASVAAFSYKLINLTGLLSIAFFYTICHIYFSYDKLNKYTKATLFTAIIFVTAGFTAHIIPGFFNSLVIDKIRISDLSCPFSMYLNFDKLIAAIILYITSGLWLIEKPIDKKSILQTILYLSLCASIVFVPSFLLGYAKLDPKLPDILWIWGANNLLFVCMGEEVIFRGFLQNKLKFFLKNKITIFSSNGFIAANSHIIISSIIFGLAHFRGGIIYVILASICGWFYGYTYEKTNRVLCSMLVHFGLNITHLILFAYPAAC